MTKGLTASFYRRKDDGTVWAIRCEGGKPVRAVGPLSDEQSARAAPFHDFTAGVDAAGWDLAQFERVGPEFVCVGYQLPQFRRAPVSRDDGDSFSFALNDQLRSRPRLRPVAPQPPGGIDAT